MKTNRLLPLSLSIVLLTGLFAPSVNAFRQPLPESEQCRFKEAIQQQKLSELAQQLERPLHRDEKMLIIKELGKRKSSDPEILLVQLVDKITNKIQQSKGKDPESEMLLAGTLVELARVRSGEVEENYIAKLEKLLSTGNGFVQTAVAIELGNIGSTKATELLFKYETKPNISPMVKVERLKADYWNLNNEDFLRAVLKSARQQIAKGDTRLVAERTILGQRGMYEALCPLSLEKEISNPLLPSQNYLQFLRETYEGLRMCEDRLYPGLSALVNLYNSSNSNALNELRKVYLDDNLYSRYRQKAYEMYLTIEMEQSGLTSREMALKHLLSNLKSTGEGHSSDWKNGSKTLEAIRNAAIVRKLIKYGKPALPYVEQELNKVSPTKEKRRYEALSYVKKRIEKSTAPKALEPKEPRFSRPEERGEDLSVLETAEVVKRLAESKDKIESRKAAKVLGDRSIAGKLDLSSKEEETIEKIVDGYLKQASATNANERVEARQQVERLWHVAAPTLLKNLSNPTIAETVLKSLILMRNETIIRALIKVAQSTEDDHTKAMAIFTLKKMKEQRKSLIPGRECLDEDQSDILYNRLVAPALRNLEEEVNP